MNKIPPQKVVLIQIDTQPLVEKTKVIISIGFAVITVIIKTSFFPELKNNNIAEAIITVLLFIGSCVATYVYFVKKPYTETGYIIIDEGKIDIFENNRYSQTLVTNNINQVTLTSIEEFKELNLMTADFTANMSFLIDDKPYSFNLLFDRKQRMDEFYARFNMIAPPLIIR